MEFFRIIDVKTSQEKIQEQVVPENVDEFAETMLFLESMEGGFKGVTLWGDFSIGYQKIKGGVRFSLLDCPNALCWTITTGYPPESEKIVLHCTINRTEKAEGFIEEVHEFLDEWEQGLTNLK